MSKDAFEEGVKAAIELLKKGFPISWRVLLDAAEGVMKSLQARAGS